MCWTKSSRPCAASPRSAPRTSPNVLTSRATAIRRPPRTPPTRSSCLEKAWWPRSTRLVHPCAPRRPPHTACGRHPRQRGRRGARLLGAAQGHHTQGDLEPDIPQAIDFYAAWEKVPDNAEFDNAFKVQWEGFLRHVAVGEDFPWDFLQAARGVQLTDLAMRSWREGCWMPVRLWADMAKRPHRPAIIHWLGDAFDRRWPGTGPRRSRPRRRGLPRDNRRERLAGGRHQAVVSRRNT